jgi:hypothetical protein
MTSFFEKKRVIGKNAGRARNATGAVKVVYGSIHHEGYSFNLKIWNVCFTVGYCWRPC